VFDAVFASMRRAERMGVRFAKANAAPTYKTRL